MINQFEVPMYLEETLPDILPDLKKASNPANIYQSVHVLLDYTFRQIKQHNITAVKKCFSLAEKLHNKGNGVVRCAIENVYVFSFSQLPIADQEEQKLVLSLIPGSLYSLYIRQVVHHGC
jgi:hypothetical protein